MLINVFALNCPHNEMKLKQNSFETVLKLCFFKFLFQPKQNAPAITVLIQFNLIVRTVEVYMQFACK